MHQLHCANFIVMLASNYFPQAVIQRQWRNLAAVNLVDTCMLAMGAFVEKNQLIMGTFMVTSGFATYNLMAKRLACHVCSYA